MICHESNIKIVRQHRSNLFIEGDLQHDTRVEILFSNFLTSAPQPPSSLSVAETRITEVDLDWEEPAFGEWDSFTVYVQEVATGDIVQEIEGIELSEITIYGLSEETEYEFWVISIRDGIESAESNHATTTTHPERDLTINEVIVSDTDDLVTVDASSSFDPIEYRIKNKTDNSIVHDWQESNEFTVGEFGTYIAVCRDAHPLGGTVEEQFTIVAGEVTFNVKDKDNLHSRYEQPIVDHLESKGWIVNLVNDAEVPSYNFSTDQVLIIRRDTSAHPYIDDLTSTHVPTIIMGVELVWGGSGSGYQIGIDSDWSWEDEADIGDNSNIFLLEYQGSSYETYTIYTQNSHCYRIRVRDQDTGYSVTTVARDRGETDYLYTTIAEAHQENRDLIYWGYVRTEQLNATGWDMFMSILTTMQDRI